MYPILSSYVMIWLDLWPPQVEPVYIYLQYLFGYYDKLFPLLNVLYFNGGNDTLGTLTHFILL